LAREARRSSSLPISGLFLNLPWLGQVKSMTLVEMSGKCRWSHHHALYLPGNRTLDR
jgi:hypothetical protein